MNLPNILTIIRLFLVPVFILTYTAGDDTAVRVSAAAIFFIASATDVLDGYIARKYNKITDFGKLADPVADKLMQLSAIGCLAINKRISMWILVLFIVKEVIMILGGINLLKEKFVVQSKWSGKIATVILFACVMIILATDEQTLPEHYATSLMCCSIVATIIAFFDYAQMYIKIKENMAKSQANKEKK